jgi:hypothetical protein
MTTEKLVNNALFGKTELKSEKVELALIDDIKGSTQGVNNFSNNVDISIKELEQVKNSLIVDLKDLKQDLDRLKKEINKFDLTTKELGLNPDSINGYKEALIAIKKGQEKINLAEKFIK